MTHPSQVCMSELQPFMTPAFIINAFQKLGHHPVNATITKKRKGGEDKEMCIIQFANEDAARQAVFKLAGKSMPSSPGYGSGKFKLAQCIGSRTAEYSIWVGDLTADVDDYHFYKFFASQYKSLCNAKVITDNRGVSKGYGFLKFSNEEERKNCLKNMPGSLGLGCRPIRVAPVAKLQAHGSGVSDSGVSDFTELNEGMSDNVKDAYNPWKIYLNWNQYDEPIEYFFAATKMKPATEKESEETTSELRLVDYNVMLNTDDHNKETLEQDRYLWDAIECTKWLPEGTLTTVSLTKV